MTFSKVHNLWLSFFECMGKKKSAEIEVVNNIQTFGII